MEVFKNVVNWFLLISTGLIFAKAFNLVTMTWVEAFTPLMLLVLGFIFILVIGTVLVVLTNNKDGEE